MVCRCNKVDLPQKLVFERCERGFTVSSISEFRVGGPLYAFDRIEDAAAFIVEQLGNADGGQ